MVIIALLSVYIYDNRPLNAQVDLFQRYQNVSQQLSLLVKL